MHEPDITDRFDIDVRNMADLFNIELPIGSVVVHAAQQRAGFVTVWYRFRRSRLKHKTKRWFSIVPTGQPFRNTLIHRATILCNDGRLVLHLLEPTGLTP